MSTEEQAILIVLGAAGVVLLVAFVVVTELSRRDLRRWRERDRQERDRLRRERGEP